MQQHCLLRDNRLYIAVSRKLPYRSIKVYRYVTIPKGIMEVVQNVVYCCLLKVCGESMKERELENSPMKMCTLTGLKSCFYNLIENRTCMSCWHTAIVMIQEKRMYILMIKINKLLFCCWIVKKNMCLSVSIKFYYKSTSILSQMPFSD